MNELTLLDEGKPEDCPVCGTPVVEPARPGEATSTNPCPKCGHLLWFQSRCIGDVTVVRMVGNQPAVMELLELLDRAVDDGLLNRLLINFGNIQQVSSAALGKLVKLMSRADAVRGKLKLCELHADLRHVFRITRLDRFFEIHETETEALAAFGV